MTTLPSVAPTGSIPVVHPGDLLTNRQRLVYVLVLGTLTALGPFTIDLYLPAFPRLEQDLGVTTASIQLTLTATTLGFALGQLLVGPLSDKVGRRGPLIAATALHVIASLGAAVAPDITVLAVFRVLQGVGAAGGAVVATAMVRDLFSGYPLVRMLSRLALINGLAPILAPVIGSQLLMVVDWRGLFWMLAGYGTIVIVGTAALIVETLPRTRRVLLGRTTLRQRFRVLFADRIFIGAALTGSMAFSGLFAYLSSSSFLFQDIYGLSAQQYGLLFAVNSIGIVLGVQSSSRLTRQFGPQWILLTAATVMLGAALAIVVFDSAGAGLAGILPALWLFITACGFAFPCVTALALSGHGEEAGTAASLLGAMNMASAGLISPIVGVLGIHSAVPMGAIMAATSMLAIGSVWLLIRPRSVPALGR